MRARLSILDLAPIARGQTATDSFAASVALARQFGTLEAMYPGRIDLGLGRAPGSDQNTTYALRRDPRTAEAFPRDVLELQAYLSGDSRVPGVDAIPGKGSKVPLCILGSSLFGAQLAGLYGLPYAFASHFAPDALEHAIAGHRSEFKPSGREPVRAPVRHEPRGDQRRASRRVAGRRGGGARGPDADLFRGGTPREVSDYLDGFLRKTGADELIVDHQAPGIENRLRSVRLLAEAMQKTADIGE